MKACYFWQRCYETALQYNGFKNNIRCLNFADSTSVSHARVLSNCSKCDVIVQKMSYVCLKKKKKVKSSNSFVFHLFSNNKLPMIQEEIFIF